MRPYAGWIDVLYIRAVLTCPVFAMATNCDFPFGSLSLELGIFVEAVPSVLIPLALA